MSMSRKPDVFDRDDFEAVKFVNQIYPDEGSLADIEKFMAMLRRQINVIDKEIAVSVKSQSGAHARARNDVTEAHVQIDELVSKVEVTQAQAEETEALVSEICRDIRKMDTAKRHLTSSITALRRLASLSSVVGQLEAAAAGEGDYKKSANLLEAVHQLAEHFQQYEDVPKVTALTTRVAAVEARLRKRVLADFRDLLGDTDVRIRPESLDRLANGCLVADALGASARSAVVDWLRQREVRIYNDVFGASCEGGQKLERFERRFGWFKTRLEEKREQWAIFPEAWRAPQMLALTFCKITKSQLKRILSDDEAELAQSVGVLITAVVAAIKFEREMAALFGGAAAAAVSKEEEEDEGGEDAVHQAGGSMAPEDVRERVEAYRRREQRAKERAAHAGLTTQERAAAADARSLFEGCISEAFEGSLGVYVAEEARELNAHLDAVLREEAEARWSPGEEDVGAAGVLQSANKLFFRIRSSLSRCSRMISRGPTLLSLSRVFSSLLLRYAAALTARLPKTATGATNVVPPYHPGSTDWHIRGDGGEEAVVCAIWRTAEFCRVTAEGACAAIVKDIRPELKSQLDMSDAEGAFGGVAAQTLSVLVLMLNTRLDIGLQQMARARWDAIEQPGDDSPFVASIRQVLLDSAHRLGNELDATSFSFLCDKMARVFVPRLSEHILRLRRISDKGTLQDGVCRMARVFVPRRSEHILRLRLISDKGTFQLSIDIDALRRALLDFPHTAAVAAAASAAAAHPHQHAGSSRPSIDGKTPDVAITSRYAAYVERELGQLGNMVKVVGSPPELLLDTFTLLMPLQLQTLAQFNLVCEMKTLTRRQTSDLVAAYHNKMGDSLPASPPPPPRAAAPTVAAPAGAAGGGARGGAPAAAAGAAAAPSFSTQRAGGAPGGDASGGVGAHAQPHHADDGSALTLPDFGTFKGNMNLITAQLQVMSANIRRPGPPAPLGPTTGTPSREPYPAHQAQQGGRPQDGAGGFGGGGGGGGQHYYAGGAPPSAVAQQPGAAGGGGGGAGAPGVASAGGGGSGGVGGGHARGASAGSSFSEATATFQERAKERFSKLFNRP
ncbi:hypothetical protein FOA52_007478 [Chlamydomonas sp. UWO 241]|nr:hypothetical protein FOA52_007478 [Chlamydomonas sp. UWO 241]